MDIYMKFSTTFVLVNRTNSVFNSVNKKAEIVCWIISSLQKQKHKHNALSLSLTGPLKMPSLTWIFKLMTLLHLKTLNLQMENKTIKYVKKQRSHYGRAGGAMQE